MRAIVLLLLLPLLGLSQSDKELKKQVATIPKGVKQVVLTIKENIPQSKVISGITRYLMDQGYEIDNIDRESGLIQTKEKNLKHAWSSRFTFMVDENIIRVKGKVIIELASDSAFDIENKGSLGDCYVYSFRELVRITNGMPHESIEYTR